MVKTNQGFKYSFKTLIKMQPWLLFTLVKADTFKI